MTPDGYSWNSGAKGVRYEAKAGDEISTICPARHMHAGGLDDRPSFNINIDKHVGNCLACGFKLNETGMYRWLMGDDVDEFILKGMAIRGALKRLFRTEWCAIGSYPAGVLQPYR